MLGAATLSLMLSLTGCATASKPLTEVKTVEVKVPVKTRIDPSLTKLYARPTKPQRGASNGDLVEYIQNLETLVKRYEGRLLDIASQ